LAEQRSAAASLPPLREVIARHGLIARKSLGQHFLLDLNLTARIARAAGDLAGRTVVEVGPGPGGLTRALLEAGADEVVVVERDQRCLAALAELGEVYPDRLRIIAGDALKLELGGLFKGPAKVVSNLPYNIGTRLLIGWIEGAEQIAGPEQFTLMFQKEVADRFLARRGSREYGLASVLVQWAFDVHRKFDVPPAAFTPSPKVTSSILNLFPRQRPAGETDFRSLSAVAKAAFGQRRKMLRASLKTLVPDPLSLLEAAGIEAQKRAQDLGVDEFCGLARAYAEWGGAALSENTS
jgi:16S rRNA (adenine1518-N6/adenine1519-N6)-dimethyltransferase